jgi:hypothetical protein
MQHPEAEQNILEKHPLLLRQSALFHSQDIGHLFCRWQSLRCGAALRIRHRPRNCAGRGPGIPPNPDEPRILFLQKARGTKKVKAFDTDNDGLTLMNNQDSS